MTAHVKQTGVQKEWTDLYVKQDNVQKEVLSAWVKQDNVVKQFYASTPVVLINPASWETNYPGSGPFTQSQAFTYSGAGPYTWSWQQASATGGAVMTIVSGQGTASATFQATCPGNGELTGDIVCNGASVSVGLTFGLGT